MTRTQTGAAPALRVRLAGPPRWSLADGRGGPLESKDALLFAWLALEGPTARLRLATLFWPDADAARGRNALRQRLHRMKKLLGVDGAVGDAVLSIGSQVQVDLGGDGGDDQTAAGELLAGVDAAGLDELADWLAEQRARRSARRSDALLAQCEQAEQAGDLPRALALANALLALQPASEPAHRRAIRLHYLHGDRAAALAAYERCRDALARWFGSAPTAETEALRAQIETAQPPPAAPARSAVPVTVLRPPRLVGRSAELAALSAAWQGGQAFVLVGEAGAGKSRLLAEQEGGGAGVVSIAARPGDAGVPYATLARLLRALLERLPAGSGGPGDSAQRAELARVLPELGATPASEAQGGAPALRLRHALEGLLASAQQAGVRALLIDDLHYADDASLESLLALMAAPALAPLRWGLACRPDGGADRGVPALDALLLALDDAQRLLRIVLTPLAEPALAELVDSLAVPAWRGESLAAPLLRHSGGNPLFALETLKAMAQSGAVAEALPRPASVAALIERRIRQLSAAALALARAAAVAETEFSIALAEHVLRSPALALADAWSELEGAQVLRGAAFAHDLVRDAVLAGVPAAIAAHLHAAIGQFLQARGGCPAARVAAHFEAGGEREQAAACWVQAGHQASTALRYVEATDAFERGARQYAEAGRSADAFDAAYQMRLAAYHVDLSARSEAALDLLDRCAATPMQRARAHNERAVMQLQRGDMAGVERHSRSGLRALSEAAEAGTVVALLRAELRRNLAGVYRARGEPHAALAELRAVQADVEQHGDGMLKFHLWNALALLLDETDDCDEACATHQRAVEQALADNYLPGAAQILVNLAMTLHDCGRARDALAPLERARMLLAGVPEAQRSFSRLPFATGVVMRALGDLGAALEHLERAVAQARVQTPGWLPMMAAERAQTLLYLGQPGRAQQALAEAAPGPQTPPPAAGKWHAVTAMLRRAQGPAGAAALVELLDGQPVGVRRLLRWRLQLQQLACAAADEDALAQAEQIAAQARDVGRLGVAIHAQVRAADLAQRLGGGGGARAAAHARGALALMERWEPDDLYTGEALAACHRALAAGGEGGGAERDACLRRAAAWVREAAPKVPAEFRDSFLNRNAANRELLTAATRLPRLAV